MVARFSTATITTTPGALELLAFFGTSPLDLIRRHFSGEWGGDADNGRVNERYLRHGAGMLLSIFRVGEERVWVISHIGGADAYTTVLLPGEY